MSITRSLFPVAALVLLAVSSAVQAQGAPFPSRPVRVVAPFPPGTPADFVVRFLSERLTAEWKQPVVVENRIGASGNIGAEPFQANSPADAAARVRAESTKWKRVVDQIGLQVD